MLQAASASLIEGRLRRRSRWRSKAWRPAAAARNRQPREVRDPVRQALRPGREELAARIRRKCRRWKHGTPAENRHGGAPRGARPPAGGRKAPRKRLGVPRKSAFTRVLDALRHVAGAAAPERRLGAPPPLGVDEGRLQTPGAMRRGNEKV